MVFGVCILILNADGTVLSVSRKDDPNDKGLPGGKVEPGETPLAAAMRELLEETGYEANDPRYWRIVYHAMSDGKLALTYEVPLTVLRKVREPSEAGVVAWVSPEMLIISKTFGEYNRGLLTTCGITARSSQKYSASGLKKKNNF